MNPDQGHHLLAANMECMVLLTLTGEGEAGAGAANSFLFKTSCSQTFTQAKSPKPASQGLLRALLLLPALGPRSGWALCRELGCKSSWSRNCKNGPWKMSVSNDLRKGAARVARVRGDAWGQAWPGLGLVKFTVKKKVRKDHVCPVIL